VTVGEIEKFVLAETAFRETHYKVQLLKRLELKNPPGVLAVNHAQSQAGYIRK
jgi:hypothetical protein